MQIRTVAMGRRSVQLTNWIDESANQSDELANRSDELANQSVDSTYWINSPTDI